MYGLDFFGTKYPQAKFKKQNCLQLAGHWMNCSLPQLHKLATWYLPTACILLFMYCKKKMSAWTGRMCAKKSCNYVQLCVYINIYTNMRISFLYIACECAPQRSKVSWLNTILWPKAEWPSEVNWKKKHVVIWMNCLFLDFLQMRFFALFKLFVFIPLKLIMKKSLSQTVLFWSWFKKMCFSTGEIPSATNVCLGFLGSSFEVRSKWSCDLMTWSLPNPQIPNS